MIPAPSLQKYTIPMGSKNHLRKNMSIWRAYYNVKNTLGWPNIIIGRLNAGEYDAPGIVQEPGDNFGQIGGQILTYLGL